jgi:Spy/CpxP family protein refolding chaperone
MKMGWKSGAITATILVAGGLLLAGMETQGSAAAQKQGAGKRALASAAPRHPLKWIEWWLDLTPKQTAQIEDIVQLAKPEARVAALATRTARKALHDDVIGGAADLKIRAAAAVLGQAVGSEAVLRARTLTAVKAVMTADQRKEFEKILTKLPRLGLRMQGRLGIQSSEPNAPADANTIVP